MQSKLKTVSKLENRAKKVITIEVIEQLKKGCHVAYEEVYVQWRKPIYTLLYSLIGNAQDAEDITQNTFTIFWEKRERIIPEKDVRAMLYVIARNSAMQFFRDRKVQQNYVDNSYFSDIDLNTSYDIIVQRETELLAEIILSKMSPQQQEIFKMSNDKGMSAEEISETLGIKRETVYQQLSRTRREMSKLLGILAIFIVP